MNEITSMITTLGFPIVACIALFVGIKYLFDNNQKMISELNADHKEEVSALTTALENNTLVLQKLCDKIDAENVSRETSTEVEG